jgi:hypothetical protein
LYHCIFDTPSHDFINADERTMKDIIKGYKDCYEPLEKGTKLRKEVRLTNGCEPVELQFRVGIIEDIKYTKKRSSFCCSFPDPFSETVPAEVIWCGVLVTRKMADEYNEWVRTSARCVGSLEEPVHQTVGEGPDRHSQQIKPFVTRVRRCLGGQYVDGLVIAVETTTHSDKSQTVKYRCLFSTLTGSESIINVDENE